MSNASSRKISCNSLYLFSKVDTVGYFCEQPDVWDLFLKINKSLLNQEFGEKQPGFLFLYTCLLRILGFTAASTKPLECSKYGVFLLQSFMIIVHTIIHNSR